jgi:hypothetical protein
MALIHLAPGAWIFLAFVVIFVLVMAWQLFTRRGSGIQERPYGARRSNLAPGARGPGEESGRDQGIPAPGS